MNPQGGFLVQSKQEELCYPSCVQRMEGELLSTKPCALGRNLSHTERANRTAGRTKNKGGSRLKHTCAHKTGGTGIGRVLGRAGGLEPRKY